MFLNLRLASNRGERRFLPEPVPATLDLETLEPVPTAFVDPELTFQASDLVFRARRVDGRTAYVYCLIEHKSYADPLVGLQLLRYMLRLWDYMLQQKKAKLPLAPIISLVFYHGGRRWNVALRYAFDRKVKTLASILTVLEAVRATPRGSEALSMVWRYLSSVGVTKRELWEVAKQTFPREGETRIMRGFLEEVFDEGVEQGLQQGMQQGAVATAQGLILDVLEVRFDGAPPTVAAHIRATRDVQALSAWHRIAATSDSIEDVVAALSTIAE